MLPSRCSFLCSDFDSVNQLFLSERIVKGGFDFIVMDPPWHNRSLDRSKHYKTFHHSRLLELELKNTFVSISSESPPLIGVWVTNNPKLSDFVREELFPKWGCSYITTWYWMKVTDSNELVMPLDDFSHRKPYEKLLIGKFDTISKSNFLSSSVPQSLVIRCVPDLHSRKPNIVPFLSSYFSKSIDDLHCLELFARNLRRGWVSWGNQVLKFQNASFFSPKQ